MHPATPFIHALTGDPQSIIDWRLINDRDDGEQARNLRGTLTDLLPTLQQYNQAGWGVFMCINAMQDTQRKTLDDVAYIRTHVADLDNTLTAQDGYNRAVSSAMPPHIAVQTSPGKFHLYWLVEPYQGNDFYKDQQRKLRQLYDGDKSVVDASRVLRVPGFYHCKGDPTLVTCWQIHSGARYTHQQIADHLQHINVVDAHTTRHPLGDPAKAAPSWELLTFALGRIDPNELDRNEWMATSAAFKQAGWSLVPEPTLYETWLKWCSQYAADDRAVNDKLWNSLNDTQVGWSRFERLTDVKYFQQFKPDQLATVQQQTEQARAMAQQLPQPAIEPVADLPDMLDTNGKKIWFKDCYFVTTEKKIFTAKARFMDQTQFNAVFGGKDFTLGDINNKITDEAWKAALRSKDWQIPKVDHVRFQPDMPTHAVIKDELRRDGLNIYIPPSVIAQQGDCSRWFDFLNRIMPCADDTQIFDSYLAHCIKYPGHKIPWAVLLQSAPGIGKQLVDEVIKYCLGETYTYTPKAEELVSGASRFNGWMREKTMITVNEIRVGERRDLLEGLKPLITDRRIAVEGKGVDQKMEDNVANWIFFSNFKDAIPVSENERRYCVFYSRLQSARQIEAEMTKEYFDGIYHWLREQGGLAAIAYYYQNHRIAKGSLPHRAPKTSSYAEVLKISRSPLEVVIDDCIAAGERGFRGGYISWPMLLKAIAASNMRSKPQDFIIEQTLQMRGYSCLGQTATPIGGEDLTRPSVIWGLGGTVEGYGVAQG